MRNGPGSVVTICDEIGAFARDSTITEQLFGIGYLLNCRSAGSINSGCIFFKMPIGTMGLSTFTIQIDPM